MRLLLLSFLFASHSFADDWVLSQGVDTKEEVLLVKKYKNQGLHYWNHSIRISEKRHQEIFAKHQYGISGKPVVKGLHSTLRLVSKNFKGWDEVSHYDALKEAMITLTKANNEEAGRFYYLLKKGEKERIKAFNENKKAPVDFENKIITPYSFATQQVYGMLLQTWKHCLENDKVSDELVEADVLLALTWGHYLKCSNNYNYSATERIVNGIEINPKALINVISNKKYQPYFDKAVCWEIIEDLLEHAIGFDQRIENQADCKKVVKLLRSLQTPHYTTTTNETKITVYLENRTFTPEAHKIEYTYDRGILIDDEPSRKGESLPETMTSVGKVFFNDYENSNGVFLNWPDVHLDSHSLVFPAPDGKSVEWNFGAADGAAAYFCSIYAGTKKNLPVSKKITSFKTIYISNGVKIDIEIATQPFIKKDYKIERKDRMHGVFKQEHLYIDGVYLGAGKLLPKSEIKSMKVKFEGKSVSIPAKHYRHISDPNLDARQTGFSRTDLLISPSTDGDSVVIRFSSGSIKVFRDGKIK